MKEIGENDFFLHIFFHIDVVKTQNIFKNSKGNFQYNRRKLFLTISLWSLIASYVEKECNVSKKMIWIEKRSHYYLNFLLTNQLDLKNLIFT